MDKMHDDSLYKHVIIGKSLYKRNILFQGNNQPRGGNSISASHRATSHNPGIDYLSFVLNNLTINIIKSSTKMSLTETLLKYRRKGEKFNVCNVPFTANIINQQRRVLCDCFDFPPLMEDCVIQKTFQPQIYSDVTLQWDILSSKKMN